MFNEAGLTISTKRWIRREKWNQNFLPSFFTSLLHDSCSSTRLTDLISFPILVFFWTLHHMTSSFSLCLRAQKEIKIHAGKINCFLHYSFITFGPWLKLLRSHLKLNPKPLTYKTWPRKMDLIPHYLKKSLVPLNESLPKSGTEPDSTSSKIRHMVH